MIRFFATVLFLLSIVGLIAGNSSTEVSTTSEGIQASLDKSSSEL